MTLDPRNGGRRSKKKKNNVPATSCPHHGGDEATYFETDPTVLEITELPARHLFLWSVRAPNGAFSLLVRLAALLVNDLVLHTHAVSRPSLHL